MNDEKTCGTCRHNRYSAMEEEFFCGCHDSEWLGCPTFYEDECEMWEEKE